MVRIPASRTAVPALPAWHVPRPALWRHLEAAAPGTLVAVVAPAGSGKTAVLAEWARHGEGPTAWVGLDRDDADPDRFWSAVHAAVLASGAVPAGDPLHHLTGDAESLADALLAGLAALPVPLRLVLDDVHVLADRQAGVRALARLVRHHPPGVRLVLAARSDPAVGLPRLRLEDGLRELRADGLRFSVGDAGALAAASGVALASEDVATLHRRTDGWAAGLRLAVLALRREGGAPGLVRFSGDEPSVADYLGGEILAGLDPDDRALLDDLSVCRRLPDALAAALSGHADVARRLEELTHGLGMVDRVAAGEHRLHVLLRAHLAADLARRRPDRHRRQHAIAARWWAEHAEPAHALYHADRAGDPSLTTELLGPLAVALLLRGELPALRRALRSVGDGALRADPRVALVAALAHLEARELPAAARLRLARRSWPAAPDRDLVALRAASELLAGARPTPGDAVTADDPGVAGLLHLARGTARLAGPGGDAATAATARGELHRALATARAEGFSHLEQAALAELALAALAEGDAAGVVGPGEAVVDAPGPPAPRTVALLAWSDLLRGEPARAADRCADLLDAPALAPADRYALRAVHGDAVGDLGRRGPGLAAARAARADLGAAPLAAPLAEALALLEHRAALRLGNLRAAGEVAAWLAGRVGEATDADTLMRAWTEAATGRWEAARAAVASLPRSPATVLVEARLLESEAALRAGDPAGGRAALDAALALGRTRDLVRPFALAGPLTRALLLEGTATPHLRRLAAACAAVTDEPAPPLSERELVVLALLPSLLDAPTMAEELVVSVNTVKTQIRSIYAKLGVSTRRAAVAEARERGLLV
ncbi:LuxR C-terminal-related transcriptional regulator [Actinomycetospora straminea]|uniref:LuxR C-terminal-related transcriptional regulator n=1 Tax=Actinomycetospora straminea TaxID=663607 RepID=UPI0031E6817F